MIESAVESSFAIDGVIAGAAGEFFGCIVGIV